LDQAPDLQHQFGRSSANAKRMAREHWIDYGHKQENRTDAVPHWDKLWLCGDTELSSCKCKGTIHYGFLNAPDTGKGIDTLDEMRYWKSYQLNSDGR